MENYYIEEIARYCPQNEEQAASRRAILWYIDRFGDGTLHRENLLAHITSSGFIMNPARDRALMIHHNIRDTWAWTGGHADGDGNLLAVALREAQEETGASAIRPLDGQIASIDVLPVYPHVKNGRQVSAHLHLSIAYLLLCDDDASLRVKPDENSGVRWFPAADVAPPLFDRADAALYGKLIARARLLP